MKLACRADCPGTTATAVIATRSAGSFAPFALTFSRVPTRSPQGSQPC